MDQPGDLQNAGQGTYRAPELPQHSRQKLLDQVEVAGAQGGERERRQHLPGILHEAAAPQPQAGLRQQRLAPRIH